MPRKSSFGFVFGIPVLLAIIMGITVLSVIGVIIYNQLNKSSSPSPTTPPSPSPSPSPGPSSSPSSGPTNYSISNFTKLADINLVWKGNQFNNGRNYNPSASSLTECVALFNEAIKLGITPAPTFFIHNGDTTGNNITVCYLLYSDSQTPLMPEHDNRTGKPTFLSTPFQAYMLTSVLDSAMSGFTPFKDQLFADYLNDQTLINLSEISLPTKVYAKILTDWNLKNLNNKATYFQVVSNGGTSTGAVIKKYRVTAPPTNSESIDKTVNANVQTYALNGT
jgi:hypothetical protein